MGMFDRVYFEKPEEAPRCFAGHPFVTELQTKDLAGNLDTYVINGGRLYKARSNEDLMTEAEGGCFSGTLNVYSPCEECTPVCHRNRGQISADGPWCEWNLHFVNGQLRETEVVALEDRNSDPSYLVDSRLPDDDPEVIRFVQKRAESMRKYRAVGRAPFA